MKQTGQAFTVGDSSLHKADVTQSITQRVRGFYEDLPFNYHESAESSAAAIARNPVLAYPDLDQLLRSGVVSTVLEIGCGSGWLSNSIAAHYGKRVTAVDMTTRALERAQQVSRALGTDGLTRFVDSDLFDFLPGEPADLVISIGVLHHTHDCRAGFDRVAGFTPAGGHFYVGLYHLYGRRPFLQLFREILKRDGEAAAADEFRRLSGAHPDATHRDSWFRDQVLHPQETQHTLAEVAGWLNEAGMKPLSTSIDGFEEPLDLAAAIELETSYEELSEQRNRREGQYFPGFFTVLARRC